MVFKKLKSQRTSNVNINRYLIDWNGKCRSKFQFQVKQWLKPYWYNHVCLEELRIPGSRMTCDIVNITKRVVVEVSGSQHEDYSEFFHRGSRSNWLGQITRDVDKRQWCEDNDYTLVEIFPDDLPLTPEFFKEKYELDLL